jgi:Holliday junction resolvase-like predicted endonuclease
MKPESVVKGRIAETIVCEMLKEAGYSVYRFGYEGILQNFTQKGLPKMKKGDIKDKLGTMPDFIVMDKKGDVSFIEVKYSSSVEKLEYLKEWLRKATKYWPEAKLILVIPQEPFFIISTLKGWLKGNVFPLERDKFIKVDKSLIEQYSSLVKKYYNQSLM